MDPLEWQISQDTANSIVAWLANTIGAAESVLRVAATGHDKRLFFKVIYYTTLIVFYLDIGLVHGFLNLRFSNLNKIIGMEGEGIVSLIIWLAHKIMLL